MHDPKDMQPGNSSGGLTSGGGPTFKPQNPLPDKFAEMVHDNSESERTTSMEYDCCGFGKDYEPLPTFVMKQKSWPLEEAADEFGDTYNEEPYNRNMSPGVGGSQPGQIRGKP